MEALIIYSLKSALVLALLYLPYTLMLRRERFFRLNRLTLLTILVLSLVQPLWRVSLPEKVTQMPVVGGTQELVWQTEAVIADDIIFVDEAPAWGWQQWLALIYVAGVAAVLCLRLWQLVQIRQTMRRGCLWRDREEGVTVWCHVGTGAPFSWMRSIYISADDYNQNGRAILLHERAHIACRHSWDILLLVIAEAVQWWNPFVYLLGRSLRDVHEFEADDHVLRQGVALSDYETLLARKALADTAYAFANNFNRSHIMRRIDMMKRPQSHPLMRGKVLYVVPVLLFTLVVTAAPTFEPLIFVDGEEVDRQRVSELQADSISHLTVLKGVSATSIYGQRAKSGAVEIETKAKEEEDFPINDIVFDIAEEMPEFVGGDAALKEYISHHLTYPSIISEYGIQGRMDVSFIVERDGAITNVTAKLNREAGSEADAVITGFHHGDDVQPNGEIVAELLHDWAASAEQLVKDMPRWKPARQNGYAVRAHVCLPIRYRLQ